VAPRKAPAPKPSGLLARTPLVEWVAAALGLLLTLGVIGYLVYQGLNDRHAPPNLSVIAAAPTAVDGGFLVPLTVRNRSPATAGSVEVRGALEAGGVTVEERRVTFAYVPGQGETIGGLIFRHDPRGYRLQVEAEGYEKP
jgi:uncharacterized protein (TIGR02588 family)